MARKARDLKTCEHCKCVEHIVNTPTRPLLSAYSSASGRATSSLDSLAASNA